MTMMWVLGRRRCISSSSFSICPATFSDVSFEHSPVMSAEHHNSSRHCCNPPEGCFTLCSHGHAQAARQGRLIEFMR